MLVQAIKSDSKRGRAVTECFERIPVALKSRVATAVDFLIPDPVRYVQYALEKHVEYPRALIFLNTVDDLSESSVVGLVAHLLALFSIQYHEKPAPHGQKWLLVDLHSDDIARSWGFQEEVDSLRSKRPQKIPLLVNYSDIVLDHSAQNQRFSADFNQVVMDLDKNEKRSFHKNNKIWYVDRYSMICGLGELRQSGIKYLHIFTSSYSVIDLRKELT